MLRACKLSLKFITKKKQKRISSLLQSYRAGVNFYIKSLWEKPGKLDKETLARLKNTRLSERYKSQALKQAIEIIVSTRKSAKELGKKVACPKFTGNAKLDAKFISIEQGQKTFDIVLKLSTLKKRHPIYLPTKSTAVMNKWKSKKDAKLIQGCSLSEQNIIVWVEVPNELPSSIQPQEVLAVDIGVNKILVDSKGNKYGTAFTSLRKKISQKKKNSNAKHKALQERNQYLDKIVNELPWGTFKAIGVENLKNLKLGKSKKRGKNFRKSLAPWTYRRVIKRLQEKAEENRVLFVFVEPAYTSQMCPKCNTVLAENRKGEKFNCLQCNYSNDSDVVGAMNILERTLLFVGSLESPTLKKILK